MQKLDLDELDLQKFNVILKDYIKGMLFLFFRPNYPQELNSFAFRILQSGHVMKAYPHNVTLLLLLTSVGPGSTDVALESFRKGLTFVFL